MWILEDQLVTRMPEAYQPHMQSFCQSVPNMHVALHTNDDINGHFFTNQKTEPGSFSHSYIEPNQIE